MGRYTLIDDDDGLDPEECSECGADDAHLYEDGDEIWLCTACAEDYPRCPCGDRGEIQITGGAPMWVCRRCAAEEEGEEA